MPTIKIALEYAEYDAVERFAKRINATPETLAYCALNRLMLDAHNPELPVEIAQTWEAHQDNLPLWSDTAGGPHGYEGKADSDPTPSRYL